MLAKLQLYKSVVVLLLKYASPVYMEPTYQEIQKLKSVLRHVLRAILGDIV